MTKSIILYRLWALLKKLYLLNYGCGIVIKKSDILTKRKWLIQADLDGINTWQFSKIESWKSPSLGEDDVEVFFKYFIPIIGSVALLIIWALLLIKLMLIFSILFFLDIYIDPQDFFPNSKAIEMVDSPHRLFHFFLKWDR